MKDLEQTTVSVASHTTELLQCKNNLYFCTDIMKRMADQGKILNIKVQLPIISFDDNGCKVVYCPALDLSGYGRTEDEAKESFQVTLEEFFRYTINKKTLDKVLSKLGWIRSSKKKISPPTMDAMLARNRNFRSIFNTHSFTKTSAAISIPAC